MSGWIKLHRKSINNPLFKKLKVWHYWQYCLLKANHETQIIIWNKKEMMVERGSFITGRKKAALETGLTEKAVRYAMETLVNLGMIQKRASKSTNKFTYLTVCNYNKYNDKILEEIDNKGQQRASKGPAKGQQGATNKKLKNDKNDKNIINLVEREELFKTQFWGTYPKRKGKRVGKAKSLKIFLKIPEEKIGRVITGVRKLSAYCLTTSSYPKDPERWLRDELWNDWQNSHEPEPIKETGTMRALRELKAKKGRENERNKR